VGGGSVSHRDLAVAGRALGVADSRIEVAGRAREGREGVDLVDALAPDVVLTDIALPVMDGVEATREILRRHPGIPVVAMTGWEYEERALEAGDAGASTMSARAGSTPTW
jgi:DNA-binding NarL/FixJ family response regulator